jgi:hypothetical protein
VLASVQMLRAALRLLLALVLAGAGLRLLLV